MKGLLLFPLLAVATFAEDLPILGLSHVGFQVSDLDHARKFYQGVLGFEPAFSNPKPDGTGTSLVFYKVNDDQYIEVSPGLAPGQDRRLTHISFQTGDIEKLHRIFTERGLNPTEMKYGRDKNRNFSFKDPDGNRLEMTQYMPGSLHSNARGKFMTANRISTHMMHAGVMVTDADRALKFYRDTLGFQEFWRGGPRDGQLSWINLRMPGTRDDYIELMISEPNPDRGRLGSMQHICLDVPDIQAAYKKVGEAGTQPKIGRNARWQVNLFDPDGSRTELMEPQPAAREAK